MKVMGRPQGQRYHRVPVQVLEAYIPTQTRWRPREPRATRCLVPTTRVWSRLRRRYNNERAMGRLNLRHRGPLGELGAAQWPLTSDRMVSYLHTFYKILRYISKINYSNISTSFESCFSRKTLPAFIFKLPKEVQTVQIFFSVNFPVYVT